MSLERRSISCSFVVRIELRILERKVGTDDGAWVVAIADIGVGSDSLVSVRNIVWVGG
jgi:hypothetical protein